MTGSIPRLTAATSTLVVVDVQDPLLAKIPAADALVRSLAFLLDAAALFQVPARATEQYPKGLGPTTAELAHRLSADLPSKTAFSCCGAAGFLADLRSLAKPNVVLTGMETHVCVAQTALDLIEAGFAIFVPVDAVASRFAVDYETALRRLERAGAIPTTAEAVAFEWAGDAAHPRFKELSRLVKSRDVAGRASSGQAEREKG